MKLVIYTANCVGNAKNCSYSNRVEISSEEELLEAVKQDHVCGEYNFVEDIYWTIKLGIFTLFHTYYPLVWSSHCVLGFLDVLS